MKTLFIFLSFFLMLLGCGENRVTGIETTNGFAGVIQDDKMPIEGAIVSLYPSDLNPITESKSILRDTTNAQGEYSFLDLESGSYNIGVSDTSRGVVLLSNLSISQDQDTLSLVPVAKLQQPASFDISLLNQNIKLGDIVYIPGTEYQQIITQDHIDAKSISLPKTPPGSIYQLSTYNQVTNKTMIIVDSLNFLENEHSVIGPFYNWSQQTRIHISLGAQGVDLASSLIHYPLLLRLTSDNFNFLQAQPRGQDLRFTSHDQLTPLPFEIEHWDSKNQIASIWVRIDTLWSGQDSQSLFMYWGNDTAISTSNSSNVFDSSNGYAGTWHLGETTQEVQNFVYPNAVGDFAWGVDSVTNTLTPPFIGLGQSFTKLDYIKIPDPHPLFKSKTNLTWGAWVKADSTSSNIRGTILTYGVSWGIRFTGSGRLLAFLYSNNEFQNSDSTTALIEDNQWHLVNATYNGNQFSLFVDGTKVSSRELTGDIQYDVQNLYDNDSNVVDVVRNDILMGRAGASDENALYFEGDLDEVRVSFKARSEEWLKLNYLTQKQNSSIIQILEPELARKSN